MAKINTISAKEVGGDLVAEDFMVDCGDKPTSITVRLPDSMVTKLKQLKADMRAKGHMVSISDLIRSALSKYFI